MSKKKTVTTKKPIATKEVAKKKTTTKKTVSKKPVTKKVANKKLKVGETVFVRFLGEGEIGEISEVVSKGVYKVKLKRGTILPNIKWLDESDKVKPVWFIEKFIETIKKDEQNKD